VIRRKTTDIRCFEKVFISDEYRSPFEFSPEIIVDAGANIGMATLYFARKYPNAKVMAIEPESSNFEMFEKNCRAVSNVTPVRAALWPKECKLKIKNPNAEAWAFAISDECSGSDSSPRVDAITVKDILCRLNTDHIDLLKIDIEGAERQLFSEGSDEWLGQVRFIIIELHDRFFPGCSRAFYSALVSHRFRQEIRGENVFIKIEDQ
jgi:FkbM family methyltransferase